MMQLETQLGEKRSAARGSLIAAFCVTLLKLVAGLMTGSLAMLSETAHSGIDLMASLLTFFSIRVSDKPADEDHTYGHAKAENLAAFAQVFLMLGSTAWILHEAINRIVSGQQALRFSFFPFFVLMVAITVDVTRSRILMRTANRTGSSALEADATHYKTDIWSSLAVLVGISLSAAGSYLHKPSLQIADPVAAIVVACFILWVTFRLGRKTADALMDAVPRGTRRKVLEAISRVQGVLEIERLRIRKSGTNYFADVRLAMARTLTFQRSEQINDEVTSAVRKVLPGSDVMVHGVPRAAILETVFDRARAVAARHNLAIHDVSVQEVNGKLHLEQHLEVDESLPLRAAHDFVSRLEAEMRSDIPQLSSILTHIESEPATIEQLAPMEQDRALEARLRRTALEFPDILDIHEVVVGRMGEHIQVSCHCTLPDELKMSRVHEIITSLEDRFKLESPEAYRVLIHPEPATDNRR
jgi:cation diffusion facilitator family transporter